MITFGEVGLQDVEALQRLMESNTDYTLRVQGTMVGGGAAQEALTALPSNTTARQKLGFGLWQGEKLLAFADVISGWPEANTAHIGLLMSDGRRHGKGLGRKLHQLLVGELSKDEGLEWLRLSIVATNAEMAKPFWIKLGYTPTDELVPYRHTTVDSQVQIWKRQLREKCSASF